ncbi:hypothetical protein EON81_25735 [bacterium]|nr:MAG: hypothetical protein EON81_25735 [bacterium]
MKTRKLLIVGGATLAVAAISGAQLKQVIKIIGVGAAVKQFGPQIDSAFNKLVKRDKKSGFKTKVVPIISGGINGRTGIGAAQVSGPSAQVDKVKNVAQLDQDLLGREIKIRAMVPISGDVITTGITPVDNVGITGIVDLKL